SAVSPPCVDREIYRRYDDLSTSGVRHTDYCNKAFFFCKDGAPRDLHSFPTRRSSDLRSLRGFPESARSAGARRRPARPPRRTPRSEEHTSELQSPCNLVCRLLREKKNGQPVRRPSGGAISAHGRFTHGGAGRHVGGAA